MRSDWPIAPRRDLADRVRAGLSRRPFPSVLLWGPTGIGKTTLADAVLAEADPARVVHLVGLEELAEVPLAPFAPVLGALGEPGDDLAQRLGNVVGAITRLQPELIVVDDAPLLDPLSAAAVYQFARLHKLPCLLIARDEHPLVGPIQRLEHEGVVERIPIGPLSERAIEALLAQRWGDHLEPASVRSIHRLSGGNPLMLRGLALAAEEQHLVHPGRHGLVVEDPRLPAQLASMMSTRLARLSTQERDAATVLALAQPLPRTIVAADADLRGLMTGGLAVDDPVTGQVALFHPLAAASLVEELDHDRDRLVARASDLLADAADDHLRLRSVMMRVRHHVDLEPAEAAWAAGFAHALQDHRLAVRLAGLAELGGQDFDAALALGSALSALGEDGAEDALRLAIARADSPLREAVATVRLGQHLALRSGRVGDALELAGEMLARIAEPDARALLDSELVKWRSMGGAALTAPDGAGERAGPARLGSLITQAMVASMTGDAEGTAAAITDARDLVEDHRAILPFAADLLDLNAFLVEVIRGRLRDADRLARDRHERPRSDATGLWSYARALLALHTGRSSQALALAERAVHELTWRDFTGVRDAALALRATAEALNGEDPTATLDLLDEAAHVDVKVRLQSAEARAWHRLGAGDPDDAARIARAAIEDGAASHHVTLASLASIVALRADRGADVADALAALRGRTSSPLVAALARWSEATTPDELASVASELDEVGLIAPAIECWLRAAGRTDQTERSRAWRRVAQERTSDDLLLLVGWPDEVALTDRERSVAAAAATRLRSHEIADELGLSVRTVDNTLARVYRKLGIRSRLDLAAALDALDGE